MRFLGFRRATFSLFEVLIIHHNERVGRVFDYSARISPGRPAIIRVLILFRSRSSVTSAIGCTHALGLATITINSRPGLPPLVLHFGVTLRHGVLVYDPSALRIGLTLLALLLLQPTLTISIGRATTTPSAHWNIIIIIEVNINIVFGVSIGTPHVSTSRGSSTVSWLSALIPSGHPGSSTVNALCLDLLLP